MQKLCPLGVLDDWFAGWASDKRERSSTLVSWRLNSPSNNLVQLNKASRSRWSADGTICIRANCFSRMETEFEIDGLLLGWWAIVALLVTVGRLVEAASAGRATIPETDCLLATIVGVLVTWAIEFPWALEAALATIELGPWGLWFDFANILTAGTVAVVDSACWWKLFGVGVNCRDRSCRSKLSYALWFPCCVRFGLTTRTCWCWYVDGCEEWSIAMRRFRPIDRQAAFGAAAESDYQRRLHVFTRKVSLASIHEECWQMEMDWLDRIESRGDIALIDSRSET